VIRTGGITPPLLACTHITSKFINKPSLQNNPRMKLNTNASCPSPHALTKYKIPSHAPLSLRERGTNHLLPSPSWGEGPGVRGFSIELNPVENLSRHMTHCSVTMKKWKQGWQPAAQARGTVQSQANPRLRNWLPYTNPKPNKSELDLEPLSPVKRGEPNMFT